MFKCLHVHEHGLRTGSAPYVPMSRAVTKRRLPRRHHRTIRDIWGNRWLVAECRPTAYRFSIYLGWRYEQGRLKTSGKAAVIVTAPLAAHIRAHAQRPNLLPLPIGDNARRRIRSQLGVDHRAWIDTRLAWWLDRIDDLGKLSDAGFVAKHGATGWTRMGTMSRTLVCQMRVALLGRKRHPVGWWKAPAVRTLVTSRLPVQDIADRLQLSPLSVYGIRYRIKQRTRPQEERLSRSQATG